MRTNRYLAAAGITAALSGGGFVLAGTSGAQTPETPSTTAPPSDRAPSDEAPAPGRNREHCPEKDGASGSGTSGSSLRTGFRVQRV